MRERAMTFSKQYIKMICRLYGDEYDDRIEDSRPPVAGKKDGKTDYRGAGSDWFPGMTAQHKSLTSFQRELADVHGIQLSTSKIHKILISGGVWTTERSREIQGLFYMLTDPENAEKALSESEAIQEIIRQLCCGTRKVRISCPTGDTVYNIQNAA